MEDVVKWKRWRRWRAGWDEMAKDAETLVVFKTSLSVERYEYTSGPEAAQNIGENTPIVSGGSSLTSKS